MRAVEKIIEVNCFIKMVRRIILFILTLVFCVCASAQVISGTVSDEASGEPLVGVTIKLAGTQNGTVTDIDGHYSIKAQFGSNQLEFSYVGYSSESRRVSTADGKDAICNVKLAVSSDLLDEIVVSAGRFEQNLNEVTVSMEVMKANEIKTQAPGDVQSALRTLSGVEIVDKQPSIRGGGGWTYSVGARSQILVDGISVLSPKTGEVNWNSVPMENIAQIEVIKGASSVLYGSNALNGVINIITDRPGLEPVTHVSPYMGIYGRYSTPSYNYATNGHEIYDRSAAGLVGARQPIYTGFDVSHTRRIGNFDFTAAANVYKDEGYRQQSYNNRVHGNLGLTYHQPMADGIYMDYGGQASYMGNKYGDFFVWRNPSEPTRPSPVTNMGREESHLNIAPHFNYTNTNTGISHKVRARYTYMKDRLVTPTASASVLDVLGKQTINPELKDELLKADGEYLKEFLDWFMQDGSINPDALNSPLGDYIDLLKNLTSIEAILNHGGSELISLITNYMKNGDFGSDEEILNGLKGTTEMLGYIFPNMTTTDIIDIAGSIMNAMNRDVDNTPDQCHSFYVDYQFAKQWKNGARITAGATWNDTRNMSLLTGYHSSDNVAAYLQYDQRFFGRLSVSAGARLEYYRIDSSYNEANLKLGKMTLPFRPVFRAGLNYQAAKGTFIRASVGQGYRNPSITEKYVRKDIGGVGAYPNKELKPESGLNVELGIKQGLQAGHWHGFVDLAAFYTEYWDMIEFQFGLFDNNTFDALETVDGIKQIVYDLLSGKPAGLGIGAKFVNRDHARIYGAELEHSGEVEVFRDSHFRYSLSYLFTEPTDAEWKERNEREKDYIDLMMKSSSNDSKYLKYRNRHTLKIAADYSYKWFSIGTNFSWRSKMLAVDYLMLDEREKDSKQLMDYFREVLFGNQKVGDFFIDDAPHNTLADYWNKHNTAYCTLDFHCGFECTKWLNIQLQLNNALNTEYSYRPMALAAPRTYVMKANFTF